METLQSHYTGTSQFRVTTMVYKAVYAIAHAIHDAICRNTNFTTQCDSSLKLNPKQVKPNKVKFHAT